jgi:hypothetical protein
VGASNTHHKNLSNNYQKGVNKMDLTNLPIGSKFKFENGKVRTVRSSSTFNAGGFIDPQLEIEFTDGYFEVLEHQPKLEGGYYRRSIQGQKWIRNWYSTPDTPHDWAYVGTDGIVFDSGVNCSGGVYESNNNFSKKGHLDGLTVDELKEKGFKYLAIIS